MPNRFEVPKELSHRYFFPQKEVTIEQKNLQSFTLEEPFLYDFAYYVNLTAIHPWENIDNYMEETLKEWAQTKESLQELFKLRDKKIVQEPMKKGIAIFIQLLHWVNGVPVKLYPSVDYSELKISTVNIEERLSYILSRPYAFPSYMQLVEMMKELQKQYEKNIAMKRLKK